MEEGEDRHANHDANGNTNATEHGGRNAGMQKRTWSHPQLKSCEVSEVTMEIREFPWFFRPEFFFAEIFGL